MASLRCARRAGRAAGRRWAAARGGQEAAALRLRTPTRMRGARPPARGLERGRLPPPGSGRCVAQGDPKPGRELAVQGEGAEPEP